MSALETEIRQALIADAALTALVGARIYWMQLPENPVYPVIAYRRISTQSLNTHGTPGAIGGNPSPGFYWSRVSFKIWSKSDDAAAELNAIVLAILAVFSHLNLAVSPESPLAVINAPNLLIGLVHGIEPNTQPPLPKTILDLKVWWQDQ